MTEERKYAILFAGTILAARKLIDADQSKSTRSKELRPSSNQGTAAVQHPFWGDVSYPIPAQQRRSFWPSTALCGNRQQAALIA